MEFMPNSRGGQDIASWIAVLRARVEQAWRLARRIHNDDASKNLAAYATELEAKLHQLEVQADVAKPPAADDAREADPAEANAAARPPSDTERKR
jgi:hypothetical protein